MARTTTNGAPTEPTLSDLTDQIEALRNDLRQITDTVSGISKANARVAADMARAEAAALRDKGEAQLKDLKSKAEAMGADATELVRTQPAAALGLAAILGFFVGLLMARK